MGSGIGTRNDFYVTNTSIELLALLYKNLKLRYASESFLDAILSSKDEGP
jgi:hypothetical protein